MLTARICCTDRQRCDSVVVCYHLAALAKQATKPQNLASDPTVRAAVARSNSFSVSPGLRGRDRRMGDGGNRDR